ESLLEAVLRQRDVAAASIVDGQGELLASSGRRSLDAHTLPDLAVTPAPRALSLSDARIAAVAPVSLDAPRIDNAERPPADAGRLIVGWVHVELDTAALSAEKRRLLLSTLLISGGVLALTLLLALGLSGAVLRPLTQLAAAVSGMTQGRLDTRVPESSGIAELRTLEQGFNAMAGAVAESQHTMQ